MNLLDQNFYTISWLKKQNGNHKSFLQLNDSDQCYKCKIKISIKKKEKETKKINLRLKCSVSKIFIIFSTPNFIKVDSTSYLKKNCFKSKFSLFFSSILYSTTFFENVTHLNKTFAWIGYNGLYLMTGFDLKNHHHKYTCWRRFVYVWPNDRTIFII